MRCSGYDLDLAYVWPFLPSRFTWLRWLERHRQPQQNAAQAPGLLNELRRSKLGILAPDGHTGSYGHGHWP